MRKRGRRIDEGIKIRLRLPRLTAREYASPTSGIFWSAVSSSSPSCLARIASHRRRHHLKRRMLQFPAFVRQMTSPPLIPTSTLFPVAAHSQNDVEALAILEAELEDKLSEIKKGNSNQTVIGKKLVDSKEELEAGAEDDEVDNAGDSEGDEFEQETG